MDTVTPAVLKQENQRFTGTMGVSMRNRTLGFQPAFRDIETGRVYLSAYRNGAPAPFHSLDGLPDELILTRSSSGRVTAVRPCIESGFVLAGCFYTREQVARY